MSTVGRRDVVGKIRERIRETKKAKKQKGRENPEAEPFGAGRGRSPSRGLDSLIFERQRIRGAVGRRKSGPDKAAKKAPMREVEAGLPLSRWIADQDDPGAPAEAVKIGESSAPGSSCDGGHKAPGPEKPGGVM